MPHARTRGAHHGGGAAGIWHRSRFGPRTFLAFTLLFANSIGARPAAAATGHPAAGGGKVGVAAAERPEPHRESLNAGTAGQEPAPFTVTASNQQLDLGARESIVLTSTLPVAGRETIVIKNMTGQIVRTLVNEARPAGTFQDPWDGMSDAGAPLRDGQYKWVAALEGEGACLSIDGSGDLDGGYDAKSHGEYEPWSAFDNIPLRIEHRFEKPGEILLVFSPVTFPIRPTCDPPQFCRWVEGFSPAGDFTYEWSGVDDSGKYRPEVRSVLVISSRERFSRNGIVVFGGRPVISGLAMTPALFRPGAGRQEPSFRVQSLRPGQGVATVTWRNQASGSILRSLVLPVVMPGRIDASWDGRGEDGTLVAPGFYTMTVSVTDGIGNASSAEALTTVEY